MHVKCGPDLLREGCTYGVIRGGSERKKKCRLPHGQNETSTVEQRVLVADCITKDGEEAGLEAPLSYLAKEKAFCEVLDIVGY